MKIAVKRKSDGYEFFCLCKPGGLYRVMGFDFDMSYQDLTKNFIILTFPQQY